MNSINWTSIIKQGLVILFIVEIVIFGVFYLGAKRRYNKYIKGLDKKEITFKELLPFGLIILDILRIRFTSRYSRRIYRKICSVYGTRYAQYYNRIHWAHKITSMSIVLILITVFGASGDINPEYIIVIPLSQIAIFFLMDRELDEKSKRRAIQIQKEFPEFITKVTLLINAGMTLNQAMRSAIGDKCNENVHYENMQEKSTLKESEDIAGSKKKSAISPLQQELEQILIDIEAGCTELEAYRDFAERCGVPQVKKFVGALIQNIKVGGSNLVYELKSQGNECWENRKGLAKRQGEIASTKLIFPMMILFAAVLLIVMAPALLALSTI